MSDPNFWRDGYWRKDKEVQKCRKRIAELEQSLHSPTETKRPQASASLGGQNSSSMSSEQLEDMLSVLQQICSLSGTSSDMKLSMVMALCTCFSQARLKLIVTPTEVENLLAAMEGAEPGAIIRTDRRGRPLT